ncbi:MAG: MBL fold metallo-hydrolase [Halocynthiibacter sp.]
MKTYILPFLMLFTPNIAPALEVVPVSDGVYAIVGETEQRTKDNLANNATFGVIVTQDGVVLVDPGGSYLGAAAIDAEIDGVTDLPVKYVINTGGQDHRWLGNGYWQDKGATVIASTAAVADQKDRASTQLSALSIFLGDQLAKTEPRYADVTFDTDYTLEFGGMTFDIRHRGQAHTPGDSFVWLENSGTVFTGDIVYVERLLGVGPQSHSGTWIDVLGEVFSLSPQMVVPGHGHPTSPARAQSESLDYLVNLRTKMGTLIEEGGDIYDAVKIDQSAFSELKQFDALAGKNAQAVYQEMEWE